MTDRVSSSGMRVCWAVAVGALIALAPLVSTQAQTGIEYLDDPTLFQEWVGGSGAEWNRTGSWVVWDPGDLLFDGSPPSTMPWDSAEEIDPGTGIPGGRPLFSANGESPSVVNDFDLGRNSWDIYGMWFVRDYDEDDGVLVPGDPANSYVIEGQPLHIGAGGINVLSSAQTILTDIWMYDDFSIIGGTNLQINGDEIHTSLSGSGRELTFERGWIHLGQGFPVITEELQEQLDELEEELGDDFDQEEVLAQLVPQEGPVIRGDGSVVHRANVFIFVDNEYTGQTIFRGGRVMIDSAEAFGTYDSIRIEDDSFSGHNRISAFTNPVTLHQNFELHGNMRFGGTTSQYVSGAPITVDGKFTVFDAPRAIGTEQDTLLTLNGDIEMVDHGITLWGFGNSHMFVNGTIEGSGDLRLAGPNTIHLLSDNIYTGDTYLGGVPVDGSTIQTGGTVVMGGNDAFGLTENIFVDGGTILQALEPITFDAEFHLNQELTLAGDNSFTFDNQLTVGPAAPGGLRLQTADPVEITDNSGVDLNNDFVIRGPGELIVDSQITGTGDVTARDGSTVRLNAENTFDGTLDIRNEAVVHLADTSGLAGSVAIVNNSALFFENGVEIGGDVAVNDLGLLHGAGEIGGDLTVHRRGVVRQGNSINTLSVGGDATFGGGVPGAQAIVKYTTESGESDRYIVDGTATFESGANLFMQQTGGGFVRGGQEYHILEAGSIVGDMDTVVTSPSLFMRFEVDDSALAANDVVVEAVRDPFETGAVGRNHVTMSRALDNIVQHGDAFGDDTVDLLIALDHSADLDAFNENLRQLSPAAYTGTVTATVEAGRGFHQQVHEQARTVREGRLGLGYGTMNSFAENLGGPTPWAMASAQPYMWDDTYRDRLDDRPEARRQTFDEPRGSARETRRSTAHENRWNVFANAYGVHERVDSRTERPGLRANTGGFALGVDYSFTENFFLGVSGGYSYTDVDFREGRGDGTIHSFRAGPYAGLTFGNLLIDASATYGYHQNDYDQNVHINGFSEEKNADFDAQELSAFVNVGYEFLMPNERTSFTPVGSLHYSHYRRDAFTETGGGAANFEIDREDVDSLEGTIGLRFEHRYRTDGASIVPNAFVGYSYEFLGDDNDVTARFAGTGESFTLSGPGPDRHALRVGAGVRALLSETVQGYIQYNGRFQSNESGHAGLIGMSFQF